MQSGLNYPDNLYADHEEAKARRVANQAPTGAYRSTDPVTKPANYQRAGIETIDYIRATLDGPGFEAYCIGNVLKYVSRYREKGGVEDLRKAQVYLGWAIQPTSGNRPNQPEACNPAAMREAKIAYDAAWDRSRGLVTFHELLAWQRMVRDGIAPERIAKVAAGNPATVPGYPIEGVPPERVPKWDPAWGKAANCDGLSARDMRGPHPMQAEAIRDHDERLAGGEDRL